MCVCVYIGVYNIIYCGFTNAYMHVYSDVYT